MLDYLKKFTSLPLELRQKVSGKEAMATIEMLEKKYQLPLAVLVMKVVVGEIAVKDLAGYLLKENLSEKTAEPLAAELKEKIFLALGNDLRAKVSSLPATQEAEKPMAKDYSVESPSEIGQESQGNGAAGTISSNKNSVKTDSERYVKGASFFFSADDEAEIRELTKKIDLAERVEFPAATVEEKLKTIIDSAQINFGSADLADRFKQILKTYLRGIRNKIETKLTLIKPFSSGGLSFDEDSAEKVMAMTDKIVHPVKSQSEIGTRSVFNGVNSKPGEAAGSLPTIKVSLPERDAPYDFSKFKKSTLEAETSHELAPLTPARQSLSGADKAGSPDKRILGPASPLASGQARQAAANQVPKKIIKPAPAAGRPISEKKFLRPEPENRVKTAPSLSQPAAGASPDVRDQRPLIRRRFEAENLNVGAKVKVEDVKYVPRVMSPLDELKYLDLINFRRLDKDPVRAAIKIKNKIDLLAEENYGKRLEGIKSWRLSPVNKLYLEIGHLSISGNKPVDVIIEERKIKNRDYLTTGEFEAIMDLNKSLRF